MTEEVKFKKLMQSLPKSKMEELWDIMAKRFSNSDTFFEFLKLVSKVASDKGEIHKRSELLKMDRIDYYISLKDDQYDELCDLPAISTEHYDEFIKNFYLGLPPFKDGVLRINRNRYFKWEVEDIDIDNQSYDVNIFDYSMDHNVWMLNNIVVIKFRWEHDHINTETNIIPPSVVFMSLVKDNESQILEQMDDKILKRKHYKELLHCTCEILKQTEQEDDEIEISNHFLAAIGNTNYILNQHKPKTLRSSNKIKTMAGEVDKEPKARYTRVLSNGIPIISEKMPRVYNKDTIRKYKIESWRTRGHIRHYKDGRVTYIRESVHHRKCLAGKGTVDPAQQIIQVV